MRILLLSMPDSFEHTPTIAIRIPNGALVSLAGNLDPHHHVAIADLVLAQSSVRRTVEQLIDQHRPDLVGLSVMTFQRATARRVIALVRSLKPDVRVVVGGYDPSLAPEAWTHPDLGVDAIVRGEGDVTFRELVSAVEDGRPFGDIAGLLYRDGDQFRQTTHREAARLERGDIRPPNRAARALSGYTMMGRPIDVVETSRGCTFDCSFCSIIEMRGRNFFRFPIARVIDDIRDARDRGARSIFLVDDNITLDVDRFESLCHAIIEAGLHRIDYLVQGMTAPIASRGDALAALMRRAGFRYVFLGIENVLDEDLAFLKAQAKNATRERGRTVGSATERAVDTIHRHGMLVVGGLIVGNPGDTRASIDANLAFARQYVDWPYIQHPTPYPGTPMTKDFIDRQLLVSEDVSEYDGTTPVVKTESLEAEEIEFLRWQAERWIKAKHFPIALAHDPLFVASHAVAMFRHVFRGSTWRTWVGLESERDAFLRYKAIRRREREFFPEPSATPASFDRATSRS